MRTKPGRRYRSLSVALAAFLAVGQLATAARAHDATDVPARAAEEAPHGAAASGASTGAAPSLRAPLLMMGAGALMAGLGGWWTYEDDHKPAPCGSLPTGRAECVQPSPGPGLGVAMIVVGAQFTLGGLIWMAIRWHERPTPVALQLGPGTLALRGTF